MHHDPGDLEACRGGAVHVPPQAFLHWHAGEGMGEVEFTDVPADYAAATHSRRSRRRRRRWARARKSSPATVVQLKYCPLTETVGAADDARAGTSPKDHSIAKSCGLLAARVFCVSCACVFVRRFLRVTAPAPGLELTEK